MSDFEFLGPYRVEAKLGKGGMGSVFRGVHRETGQRVAIKVLANDMATEPRFRNRFASEIQTLEKLSHPNIVRLIAWPKDLDDPDKRESYRGPLFYSMELVEGPSLLEHLRKVKRLDWDTTIGYAIEICSALKHAHDMGVIHRDLKPANLLLEPEGTIKLTDFGIAKLFGAAEQTAAGAVLGTADYMAPEQASGGKITERTDLYALGSLMYACLAGRPPFGGRSLTRVIHGLKHETPPPLDLVLPDVPPELAELIHELLEKEPEDRPRTALVVSKRLKAMRAGLRRRGELTRFDTDSQTLPEVPSDKISTNPILRNPNRGSVADQPTAAEKHVDEATGHSLAKSDPYTDETQDSRFRASATDAELRLRQGPASVHSRYDTLPEAIQTTTKRETSKTDSGSNNWTSVITLTLLLLSVIGLLAWAFRKPSAETLFSRVQQAIEVENFKDARTSLKELIRVYPNDARIAELEDKLPSESVEAMLRKLDRRSVLSSPKKNISVPQQAWLDALALRHEHPARAIEQLSAWLAVYNQPRLTLANAKAGEMAHDAEDIRELAMLAEQELIRLKSLPIELRNPRASELKVWIEDGQRTLSGDELESFKDGVRLLYADKEWAQPILQLLD